MEDSRNHNSNKVSVAPPIRAATSVRSCEACAYEAPRSLISRAVSSLNSRVNFRLSVIYLRFHHDTLTWCRGTGSRPILCSWAGIRWKVVRPPATYLYGEGSGSAASQLQIRLPFTIGHNCMGPAGAVWGARAMVGLGVGLPGAVSCPG